MTTFSLIGSWLLVGGGGSQGGSGDSGDIAGKIGTGCGLGASSYALSGAVRPASGSSVYVSSTNNGPGSLTITLVA